MKISTLKTLTTPNLNDLLPILDINGGVSGKPILRKATLSSLLALASNNNPDDITAIITTLETSNTSLSNRVTSTENVNTTQDTDITELSTRITTLEDASNSNFAIPSAIKTVASDSDYFIGIDANAQIYKILKSSLFAGLKTNTQATTLLLLHGEGTNNGTSIIDSSAYNRVPTKTGNPVTSTAQKKFNNSSLYFDGASYLTFATSTDFDFKQNNFAMQMWIYPTALGVSRAIVDRYSSTIPLSWQFALSNGKLNFYIRSTDASTSALNLTGDTTLNINTGYWVGVRRVNGVFSLWLNGELDAVQTLGVSLNSTLPLTIGKQGNVNNYYYQGYLDELILLKGGETDLSVVPTSAFS